MRTFYCKTLFGVLMFLNVIFKSVSTPAVTHLHSMRTSGEREEDGAYSPRNRKHQVSGEHHSEFDHEAILGKVCRSFYSATAFRKTKLFFRACFITYTSF